jgi:hypothetical protein
MRTYVRVGQFGVVPLDDMDQVPECHLDQKPEGNAFRALVT